MRVAEPKASKFPATESQRRFLLSSYATNLSAEQAPAEMIPTLYSLRWQIELIFKTWKSGVGLTQVRHASTKDALLTFVYARLLYGVVMLFARQCLFPNAGEKEIGILR